MRDFVQSFLVLAHRFLWSSQTVTRSAPFVRDANNVQRVWNYFVIASLPACVIGLWSLGHQTNLAIADFQLESVTGWRAGLLAGLGLGFDPLSLADCIAHGLVWFLPIFGVALLVGAFWEVLFATLRRKPVDEGLLVTAWFLALLLPATTPLYQVALGMSFGIVVGKLIYGGSGRYLVNPALLGLAFLLFSYHNVLFGEGAWVPVAGYDQPTVLELVNDEGGLPVIAAVDYDFLQLFFGDRPGSVGVVSTFGALLGALFLVWSGMASWRIMLGALLGLAGMSLVCNFAAPQHELFSIPWHWLLHGVPRDRSRCRADDRSGPLGLRPAGGLAHGAGARGQSFLLRRGDVRHSAGQHFCAPDRSCGGEPEHPPPPASAEGADR
jgi:Na+-transporting NADH:ubiquinone oxidoreductase subunit B